MIIIINVLYNVIVYKVGHLPRENALTFYNKTNSKTQFVLIANSYMLRHQDVILRESNNNNNKES